MEAENNQEDDKAGFRKVPFSKELYIERDDFKEEANSKYFRLSLGKEVRLKNAYIIKGESVIKDEDGNILEIHCTYDADSLSRITSYNVCYTKLLRQEEADSAIQELNGYSMDGRSLTVNEARERAPRGGGGGFGGGGRY